MTLKKNMHELEAQLSQLSAQDGLALIAELFPGKVTFSTSLGQEDQVITQLIADAHLPISIFSLDTGRLFPETLDLLSRTEAKYNQNINVYYPTTDSVERVVSAIGINGFYDSVENRKSCCFVRKVEPLRRALAGNEVWVTGLRAEQSANRSDMKRIEWDEGNQILKFNPLLDWTFEDMINYINEKNIPYNPLHDKGFISIGCAPCTRAIMEGEDARAGRWWWEDSKKECGLHAK
ncbi:phosphoadenylyl-sulfate reductase [Algoriphagus sp.]|uniref:phosphoadenylyl-sulfate reductase n=1 Tax=Algoriphagus sp. TaxID=1872435 RepID=UPI00329013FD